MEHARRTLTVINLSNRGIVEICLMLACSLQEETLSLILSHSFSLSVFLSLLLPLFLVTHVKMGSLLSSMFLSAVRGVWESHFHSSLTLLYLSLPFFFLLSLPFKHILFFFSLTLPVRFFSLFLVLFLSFFYFFACLYLFLFNLYFFHTSLHLSSARLLYNPLSLPIIPHDECSHFLSSYSSRLFFFSLNFSPHHSFYPFSISHPFLSSLLQTISRISYVSLALPSVSIFPSLVFLSLSKISLSLFLLSKNHLSLHPFSYRLLFFLLHTHCYILLSYIYIIMSLPLPLHRFYLIPLLIFRHSRSILFIHSYTSSLFHPHHSVF